MADKQNGLTDSYSVVMPIHQFFPQIGGAEQQAQRLGASLVRLGHRVTVLTGWWDRRIPQQEVIDGIAVYRNNTLTEWIDRFRPIGLLRQYTYEASLMWFLWRNRSRYDLIHVHQALHAAVFSTLVAKMMGKRIIIKVGCGGPLSDLKMMKGCRLTPFGKPFWRIIKMCDRIIAINREIAAELLQDGFAPHQVLRISNGVPVQGMPVKESYLGQTPLRLVSVGRLDPQKGFDVLLQALSLLKGIVFRCSIFGGGAEKEALAGAIDEKGLAGRVQMVGIVHDLRHRLPAQDIFILPSRAEGLSNALMEAMVAGMPCIATNIGGNSDLMAPGLAPQVAPGDFFAGGNGVLVNVDDAPGLARAIDHLAEDPVLRERLGRSARRWIVEHCSMESVTQQYLKLYQELVPKESKRSC